MCPYFHVKKSKGRFRASRNELLQLHRMRCTGSIDALHMLSHVPGIDRRETSAVRDLVVGRVSQLP